MKKRKKSYEYRAIYHMKFISIILVLASRFIGAFFMMKGGKNKDKWKK